MSSDGLNASNQFISSGATVLSQGYNLSGKNKNDTMKLSLLHSDNRLCIPAGKVIGISGSNTQADICFTLEFEELPLLIGGNDRNLGNIYCYSFALKPEEHQPSGTCNFSRIDNAQLIFDDSPSGSGCVLKVFAVNYNVLRIMSGMGGLAYSN